MEKPPSDEIITNYAKDMAYALKIADIISHIRQQRTLSKLQYYNKVLNEITSAPHLKKEKPLRLTEIIPSLKEAEPSLKSRIRRKIERAKEAIRI